MLQHVPKGMGVLPQDHGDVFRRTFCQLETGLSKSFTASMLFSVVLWWFHHPRLFSMYKRCRTVSVSIIITGHVIWTQHQPHPLPPHTTALATPFAGGFHMRQVTAHGSQQKTPGCVFKKSKKRVRFHWTEEKIWYKTTAPWLPIASRCHPASNK